MFWSYSKYCQISMCYDWTSFLNNWISVGTAHKIVHEDLSKISCHKFIKLKRVQLSSQFSWEQLLHSSYSQIWLPQRKVSCYIVKFTLFIDWRVCVCVCVYVCMCVYWTNKNCFSNSISICMNDFFFCTSILIFTNLAHFYFPPWDNFIGKHQRGEYIVFSKITEKIWNKFLVKEV